MQCHAGSGGVSRVRKGKWRVIEMNLQSAARDSANSTDGGVREGVETKKAVSLTHLDSLAQSDS
jgi:hypothetical protein